MSKNLRKIVIGITGASGAMYGARTVGALLARGCQVELIVSDFGRRLLLEELGPEAAIDRFDSYLIGRYGEEVKKGSLILHSNKDCGATIASGSFSCEGMAIVPCSMKTLSGVAHGSSQNLIERAADVMLKENRRLIVVPRETPMSLLQLRNLVLCSEAGAVVLPAMPAFYQKPKTIDDLADFVAGKVLSAFGIEQQLYPAWKG
jgi:4-hydroxy-3-polyprenylbenzoate decarboxylase